MNYKMILLCVAALAISFAAGRWLAPTKVKIEKQVVEVEKKTQTTNTDLDRDKHKTVVVVEVKHPDGTTETTTKTVEDTKTTKDIHTVEHDDISKKETDTKEVTRHVSGATVSFLYGAPVSFPGGLGSPLYGGAITQPILGPVTLGAWGLSNATAGVSLGLTF